MQKRRHRPGFDARAELEFRITDEECFLIVESGRRACDVVLEENVPQSSGAVVQYLSVFDAAPVRVLADALDWPTTIDATIVAETGDGALVSLVASGDSLLTTVGDSGGIPRRISASNGVGRVVVSAPPSIDPQRIVDQFRARYPDSVLLSRREHGVGALFGERSASERIHADLTDRQLETLVVAYENGYFERPRRATATECAERLGISQSTFSQHVQVGLQKILAGLLAEWSEE